MDGPVPQLWSSVMQRCAYVRVCVDVGEGWVAGGGCVSVLVLGGPYNCLSWVHLSIV